MEEEEKPEKKQRAGGKGRSRPWAPVEKEEVVREGKPESGSSETELVGAGKGKSEFQAAQSGLKAQGLSL